MFRNRVRTSCIFFFFFFNDTATTEIYTLSLHDALPILKMNSVLMRGLNEDEAAPLLRFALTHGYELRRSEEHTSELQSQSNLVCRLLLEKKKKTNKPVIQCKQTYT